MERENSFYYYYCYYYRSVTDDGATDQSERSSETSDERHAEESDWRPGRPIRLNGVLDRRLLTVLGRKDHARGGFLFCFLLFFCCCFFLRWVLFKGFWLALWRFNRERVSLQLGAQTKDARPTVNVRSPYLHTAPTAFSFFLSLFLSFFLSLSTHPPPPLPATTKKKPKKKLFFPFFF